MTITCALLVHTFPSLCKHGQATVPEDLYLLLLLHALHLLLKNHKALVHGMLYIISPVKYGNSAFVLPLCVMNIKTFKSRVICRSYKTVEDSYIKFPNDGSFVHKPHRILFYRNLTEYDFKSIVF